MTSVRPIDSWIAVPDGSMYCHRGGHALLGDAGSWDVLAGALVGMAARGATPWAATIPAVVAHAQAGELLAAIGPPSGRFARELLDVLAGVVDGLSQQSPIIAPPARSG